MRRPTACHGARDPVLKPCPLTGSAPGAGQPVVLRTSSYLLKPPLSLMAKQGMGQEVCGGAADRSMGLCGALVERGRNVGWHAHLHPHEVLRLIGPVRRPRPPDPSGGNFDVPVLWIVHLSSSPGSLAERPSVDRFERLVRPRRRWWLRRTTGKPTSRLTPRSAKRTANRLNRPEGLAASWRWTARAVRDQHAGSVQGEEIAPCVGPMRSFANAPVWTTRRAVGQVRSACDPVRGSSHSSARSRCVHRMCRRSRRWPGVVSRWTRSVSASPLVSSLCSQFRAATPMSSWGRQAGSRIVGPTHASPGDQAVASLGVTGSQGGRQLNGPAAPGSSAAMRAFIRSSQGCRGSGVASRRRRMRAALGSGAGVGGAARVRSDSV